MAFARIFNAAYAPSPSPLLPDLTRCGLRSPRASQEMCNLVGHGKWFNRSSTEWGIGSDRGIYREQGILAKKKQA